MENKVLTADIVGAELRFRGDMSYGDFEEGFGAIKLSNGGRSYVLDVIQSYCTNEMDETIFELELEEDEKTFADCKYDLTDADLSDENLEATIYIGDFSNELISANLIVILNGKIKSINLKLED